MNRLLNLALVAFTFSLVAPLTVGCSAASTEEAESADNDIVSGGSLGDVAAVSVGGFRKQTITLAAPAKVARILENLGLGDAKATSLREEADMAGVPQEMIGFYDASGEPVAYAHFIYIDGTSGVLDRKNAKGVLVFRGKTYAVTAKDLDAVDAIAKEPRAFADIVYGADRVVFTRPMEPWMNVDSKDGALITKVLGAFKADEVPDPKASFMRCPPATGVTFIKGTKELASVGLSCDDAITGVIQGSLTVPVAGDPGGAVQVDTSIIGEARKTLPNGTDEELPGG